MHKHKIAAAAVAVIALVFAGQAFAGKIVLTNDEWTLSNTGFTNAPTSTTDFVENVTDWFTGGGSGTFHAFSTNFGLTGTDLDTAMSNAGHTYTTGFGPSFDLATLLSYDGIFLAGPGAALDTSVLIDYVNAGGMSTSPVGPGFFLAALRLKPRSGILS